MTVCHLHEPPAFPWEIVERGGEGNDRTVQIGGLYAVGDPPTGPVSQFYGDGRRQYTNEERERTLCG